MSTFADTLRQLVQEHQRRQELETAPRKIPVMVTPRPGAKAQPAVRVKVLNQHLLNKALGEPMYDGAEPDEPVAQAPSGDGRVGHVEKLRGTTASVSPVDNMPMYGSDPDPVAVAEMVARGEKPHAAMLNGMAPEDIAWAYREGTAFPSEAGPSARPGVPVPRVSPDMRTAPGGVARQYEVDPRSEPGSRAHPVEARYGAVDSLVEKHGWAPQMFTKERSTEPARSVGGDSVRPYLPDLENAITAEQAMQLIAGQLAARRMRVMGSQDPSMQRGPEGVIDADLLNAYGKGPVY